MPARNILVINCGSSSIKFALVNEAHSQFPLSGLAERLGNHDAVLHWQRGGERDSLMIPNADHRAALAQLLPLVQAAAGGQLHGIGHRVVHGGEHFTAASRLDEAALQAIRATAPLAPLHNPANLSGIEAAIKLFPNLPQVAVFDTAFHQTLPEHAFRYALPDSLYREHGVRRYGFHGTSHRFVAARALEMMRRFPDNTNLITCHLGNGASVTAIENGRSIDTSMGFTPLEGLMMGTRSGDLDPAILGYLEERGYTAKELLNILNKKSGLLGLSGISNDLRDLEAAVDAGDQRAGEALDVYAHKVRKYIGSYAAELVKVDGLVFTGGIGQHGVRMRERICHCLEHMGIVMDYHQNVQQGSREGLVSAPYSRTSILVIPTNEELQIAIDAYVLLFPYHAGKRQRASDVIL